MIGPFIDYSAKDAGGKRKFRAGCMACGWRYVSDDEDATFYALDVHYEECGGPSRTALDHSYDLWLFHGEDPIQILLRIHAAKDYAIGENLTAVAHRIGESLRNNGPAWECISRVEIHRIEDVTFPPCNCDANPDTLEAYHNFSV